MASSSGGSVPGLDQLQQIGNQLIDATNQVNSALFTIQKDLLAPQAETSIVKELRYTA